MKKAMLLVGAILTTVSAAHAVEIGSFPGLDELIKKADAIVILRVDRHVDARKLISDYTTHDCHIFQTLKGAIPKNKRIRLQLLDTRSSSARPFTRYSNHLMFLTKKRAPNEPTDFRTIEFQGANVSLPPTGNHKQPKGKTVADQIRSVLRRGADHNKKKYEQERTFLDQMIKGAAVTNVRIEVYQPRIGLSKGEFRLRNTTLRFSDKGIRRGPYLFPTDQMYRRFPGEPPLRLRR